MAFHTKYRPQTLDRVLGHESAVATLRKFAQAGKEDFPSALLLVGPPSAGKTTLARAFAREVLGDHFDSNFEETNFGTHRSIDDVRGLVRLANLRPMSGGRRFIMCDEAHAILSNAPAADALLKPLEEPIVSTTWILATMEPDKFNSTVKGRALKSRCVTIKLNAPEEDERLKYANRINKGEKLKLTAEQLGTIAAAGASFRDVANIMESLSQSNDIETALANISVEETPEELAMMRGLAYGLAGKYGPAVKQLIGIKNGVGLIQSAGYLAWSLVVLEATDGSGAPGVWITQKQRLVYSRIKSTVENDFQRERLFARFNDEVIQLKISSGAFAVNEVQALCGMLSHFMAKE
jgi:DNA polymerase III delta prime subunit